MICREEIIEGLLKAQSSDNLNYKDEEDDEKENTATTYLVQSANRRNWGRRSRRIGAVMKWSDSQDTKLLTFCEDCNGNDVYFIFEQKSGLGSIYCI